MIVSIVQRIKDLFKPSKPLYTKSPRKLTREDLALAIIRLQDSMWSRVYDISQMRIIRHDNDSRTFVFTLPSVDYSEIHVTPTSIKWRGQRYDEPDPGEGLSVNEWLDANHE